MGYYNTLSLTPPDLDQAWWDYLDGGSLPRFERAPLSASSATVPCPSCGAALVAPTTCPNGCNVRVWRLGDEARALIERLIAARSEARTLADYRRIAAVLERAERRERRRALVELAQPAPF